MENKREHSTNHAIPKTSKEIIVNSLTELFADDEFGFDMFIMMKTVEPSMNMQWQKRQGAIKIFFTS